MTTITTDEAAPSAGTEGPTSEPPTSRPRRFAPRRSRSSAQSSAAKDSATAGESASITASDAADDPGLSLSPPTTDDILAGAAAPPVEGLPTAVGRSRRGRDRRPHANASVSEVAALARPDTAAGPDNSSSTVESFPRPDLVGESPAIELPTAVPPTRRSPAPRGTRRGPQSARGALDTVVMGNSPVISEADAETTKIATTRPTQARRVRSGRQAPSVKQIDVPAIPVVAEATLEPLAGVVEVTAHADADLSSTTEPEAGTEPTADTVGGFGSELADLFGLTSREAAAATADLEGADLLAKALREMFPPIDNAGAVPAGIAPDDNLPDFDFDAAAAAFDAVLDALPEAEETEEDDADEGPEPAGDSEEAQRRRSRRGRRGGRGRRRNGLVMLPSLENGESVSAEPVPIRPEVSATQPALPPPTPVQAQPEPISAMRAADATPSSPFIPEDPPRSEPNWREQRPRRNWERAPSRDTTRTEMPPPKPSSTRFIPIPQAAPPPAAYVSTAAVVSPTTPFTMPDLRTDEPLGPGETRSERLLQIQTRLMAAMLEQQARQIDVLTAGVSALSQALQGLGGGIGGSRANLPRTGIFVDAPNVVYAADNARVSIDYGRMLKYLSRDRQLVHALSYSPIIDDIREGIRYETQRFVAPFLRAGYKLITKPLKRFSDGSAKGNFDIELALDILTMAERLDIVVLVSGDSDFESVIEHIQSQGVRVEVVAFASNVSTELVNVADTFIDISQHLEHMRPL